MMNQEQRAKLQNQICFPIYLCAKEITGKYTELLKPINLTYTQYIVMLYFWDRGESNLKEVSRTLMLDASTISPIITKLETKGFLEKKRLDSDERNLVINLTEKGKSIRKQALQVPEKVAQALGIDSEEAGELHEIACNILFKIRQSNKEK